MNPQDLALLLQLITNGRNNGFAGQAQTPGYIPPQNNPIAQPVLNDGTQLTSAIGQNQSGTPIQTDWVSNILNLINQLKNNGSAGITQVPGYSPPSYTPIQQPALNDGTQLTTQVQPQINQPYLGQPAVLGGATYQPSIQPNQPQQYVQNDWMDQIRKTLSQIANTSNQYAPKQINYQQPIMSPVGQPYGNNDSAPFMGNLTPNYSQAWSGQPAGEDYGQSGPLGSIASSSAYQNAPLTKLSSGGFNDSAISSTQNGYSEENPLLRASRIVNQRRSAAM